MGAIEIFKLFGSIFVDNDEANKSISKTGKQADGLGKKFTNGIKTAGKWALGLTTAAAGVGAAAFAMTNKVTSSFDDIAKTSQRLGITTDAYQELNYWANQNGIAASSMERAVGRLNQRIGMAKDGSDKYAGALERLGVSYKDIEAGNVSTEDAMATVLQTLSEMESESEKASAAADLFGTRMGRDLMTALQDGSMSMDEAKEKAEELGLVIDEDVINAGVSFQDNLTDMTMALGAIGNKIISNLIPIFNRMTDWILGNMPTIQSVFQRVFDAIGTVFGIGIGWVQSFIGWIMTLYDENESVFKGLWDSIQNYLGFIIGYWQTVFETAKEIISDVFEVVVPIVIGAIQWIREFWEENGEQLLEGFFRIFNSIKDVVMTVFESFRTIVGQVLEWAIPFIQDKLQVLYDFWEENGQQIMEAVSNAFNFIKSIIEFIMPAVLFIVEMVWNNIKGVINGALDVIMGVIKVFTGLFTGDWSKMWEGVKQLLLGAVEFIWNFMQLTFIGRGLKMITNFGKLAVNLFRNMGSGVVNIFRNLGTNVMKAITNLLSRITGSFKGLSKNALSWGKDLISGFWQGIKSMGSWIAGKVSGFVTKFIPGPIKKVLKIASPSGLTEEYGEDTGEGFIVGMDSKGSDVERAAEQMAIAAEPSDFGRQLLHGNDSHQSTNTTINNDFSKIIDLLMELIQAVREGKEIIINGRKLNEEMDDEQGKRINMKGRRVAY